jgi:hypothetical protein
LLFAKEPLRLKTPPAIQPAPRGIANNRFPKADFRVTNPSPARALAIGREFSTITDGVGARVVESAGFLRLR